MLKSFWNRTETFGRLCLGVEVVKICKTRASCSFRHLILQKLVGSGLAFGILVGYRQKYQPLQYFDDDIAVSM